MRLWHASPYGYRESIERDGLLPKHPVREGHWSDCGYTLSPQPVGVYCVTLQRRAIEWARDYRCERYHDEPVDIWRFDVRDRDLRYVIRDPELYYGAFRIVLRNIDYLRHGLTRVHTVE